MTCTCYQWQMTGIPYGHTLAVCLARKEDPQTYAKGFYRLNAYHGTYAASIFPPNVNAASATVNIYPIAGFVEVRENTNVLLPPKTRRPPGRPKKQRIRGANEVGGRAKRIHRCGRCGNTGHSRVSCRERI